MTKKNFFKFPAPIKYAVLISILLLNLHAQSTKASENQHILNAVCQYKNSIKLTFRQNIFFVNDTAESELIEEINDIKAQLVSAQNEIANLQESNYNLKKDLSNMEDKIKKLESQKICLENSY